MPPDPATAPTPDDTEGTDAVEPSGDDVRRPSNFIILYSGREGSSPIVSALSHLPQVHVPVFEELDAFWIDKFYGSIDIAAELDRVFETGDLGWEHDYGRRKFLDQSDKPGPCSIGFKWRPHGPSHEIAEVLKRHDVVVFVLFRRDLVDLAASLFFTKTAQYGHMQFRTAAMSERERAAFKAQMDARKAPFRPWIFHRVMAKRIYQALRNRRFAQFLVRRGLPVEIIHYEDFKTDPDAFLRQFCARIGIEPGESGPLGKTSFVKLSEKRPFERIEKHEILIKSPVIWLFCRLYARLVSPLRQG